MRSRSSKGNHGLHGFNGLLINEHEFYEFNEIRTMKTTMEIKVTTVQHGFALEVENKQWLLESEQELAEAVVFRVALGCMSDVSKKRMRKLLNMLSYGDRRRHMARLNEMCNGKYRKPYFKRTKH